MIRKISIAALSVLMLLLPVPSAANAAYAADAPDNNELIREAIELAEGSPAPADDSVKIPGASAASAASVVQSDPGTVTTDNFHDDTLPEAGWITLDADGDGYAWMNAEDVSPTLLSLSGEDSRCIISMSYHNSLGPLTPDNWLISPKFTVPRDTQLQWFTAGQSSEDFMEHYAVYISTGPQTDLSSYSLLYEETLSSGKTYKGAAADLTSYAGQQVYVAFRHYGVTDMFYLNLDGVGLAPAGTEPEVPRPDLKIIRVKGQNRYETSIEIARQLLTDLGENKYPNAMITTGDNFADALAGSALSARLKAPMILVSSKSPASIDNALRFIKSYVSPNGIVAILGGTGVVPASLEQSLSSIGYDSVRLAGRTRYDTNLLVLDALGLTEGTSLYVCDGTNWPDAATASAVGAPMLLLPKTGLTEEQKTFLDQLNARFDVTVVGGEGVIPASALSQLTPYDADGSPLRLAGMNRAETAAAVAEHVWGNAPDALTFAYGGNFPDCIAGGLLANYMDAPILYGDRKSPGSYLAADAPYAQACRPYRAYVLGGETLVDDAFVLEVLNK